MKVLSLTEPCATLIKENVKKVETRSWKTSYRGELYIHASLTKITKLFIFYFTYVFKLPKKFVHAMGKFIKNIIVMEQKWI